jgi:large subunit ribosomal protein L29
MVANEMRKMSPAELEKRLLELRKEQFVLRMQQGSGQLSRPSQMKSVGREIARVKTILTEQARGGVNV